jgi:Lrp/AsnC family leucine-responsive transcriptional regulator
MNDEYIVANCSILDPAKFGLGQMCFMLVEMRSQDQDSVSEFLKLAESDDSVLEIHEMTGICDYLMKVRVGNMAEATRLSQKLASKVANIHTHAAGESRKEGTAIPLPGLILI